MIPLKYQLKIGVHHLQIGPAKLKVCLVDNMDVLESILEELTASIQEKSYPPVGIDCKLDINKNVVILILCGSDRCMILLYEIQSVHDSLKKFLDNRSICLVGMGIPNKIPILYDDGNEMVTLDDVVELSDLTAKILKKLTLCGVKKFRKLLEEVTIVTYLSNDDNDNVIEVCR